MMLKIGIVIFAVLVVLVLCVLIGAGITRYECTSRMDAHAENIWTTPADHVRGLDFAAPGGFRYI
jgi:hypothetical protein